MKVKILGKKYNDYIAYGIRFLGGLRFNLPIWFFFYTQYLGVSITLSTIIALISTGVGMVFEIPTGTWADKYGRKKIYLLGLIISLVGLIPLVVTKNIIFIILGSIVGGFGGALVSGTLSSLIFDWFKEKSNDEGYKKYARTGSMLVFGGRSLATIIGGWLFTLNPLFPYFALLGASILQIFLATSLYESKIDHEYTNTPTLLFIKQGRKYLTSSYQLNTVLIGFLIGYFFGSVVRGLYQPYLEANGLSIQQIGRFYAGASLVSMLGSHVTKYLYKKTGMEYKLTIIYLVLIAITLGVFIVFEGVLILLGVVLIQLAFGMHVPITSNAINQHIPSSHRATANSIFSLLDTSGRFIGGSICGYLFTQFGFTTIRISMIIGVGVLLLYVISRKITTDVIELDIEE